ncbi:MAG: hypothetical protein FVQ80_11610 [Planctomycetes bacterium]|nr:hypothetical protein [Planctomycetota bacterium]
MIVLITERVSDGNRWIDLYDDIEQAIELLIDEHKIEKPELLRAEEKTGSIDGYLYKQQFLLELQDDDIEEAMLLTTKEATNHCVSAHQPLPPGVYSGVVSEVKVESPRNLTMKIELLPEIDVTEMCVNCGKAPAVKAKLCKECWDGEEGSDD